MEDLIRLLAVLVPVLGAGVTGWLMLRGNRRMSEASPYEALASRVTSLETQVDQLRADRIKDRDLIRQMWAWIAEEFPHVTPPFRRPAWMSDIDHQETYHD